MQKQVRVYSPGGSPLGTVFDELKCEISVMGRGQSTGSLVVPAWSEANRWLENSMAIVAVEIFVNGAWVEPPNCRFTATGWERDSRDRSGGGTLARTYQLTSIAWTLKGASPGLPITSATPQFTNEKGDEWVFDNVTPGTVLRTLFDAANALNSASFGGWGQALSQGTWTATADSDGKPWQYKLDFTHDLEKNMWDALDSLYARGVIDWELEAGVVSIRNPRSRVYEQSGKALTVLRLSEMDDATEKNTVTDLVNHVFVRGVDLVEGEMNAWWEFHDEASTGVYGGLTKVVQAGGVMTQGAASLLAQQIFELNGKPQLEITRAYNHLNTVAPQPFVDFALGEWVSVERLIRNLGVEDAIKEPYRVVKIHITDNDIVQLTLGTMQEDMNDYLSRMVAAATGGGLISDTGTSKPPKTPDAAQPAQVTGLIVESFNRPGVGGFFIGGAFARWTAVTKSTGGLDIDLLFYEVQVARLVTDGAQVAWGEITPIGGVDYQTEEIPPGERVGIRVRAVSKAQVRGAWSTPGYATVVKDVVPPPPSSKPLLETGAGTVTIRTDGKAQDGTEMPFDFSHRIVQRAPVNTSSWVSIGELSARTQGFTIDGPITAGATYQYRFLAVDTVGNVSTPSLAASITVASIADDPAYIKAVADAKADSTVAADLARAAQAAAVAVGEVDGKRFTMSTLAPTTAVGYPAGATWTQRDATGAQIGFFELVGGSWVSRPLSRVAIPAIDIGTGTFGDLTGARLTTWSVTADKVLIGAGRNLIPNDGFETGVAPHVGAGGTITQVTDPVFHGTYSLRLATTPGVTQSSVSFAGSAKNVKVRAGQKFKFKATYRVPFDAAQVTSVQLRVFYYDASMTYIGGTVGYSESPSTVWRTIQDIFTVTNAAAEYVSARLYVLSPSGHTGANLYIDLVSFAEMETGELIVDGAINAVKINTASLAADTGFVNNLWLNNLFVGTATAKIVISDMFVGKVFTGGTFNGQTVNSVTINGADINLVSQTYGSGKLRVQVAGSSRAVQLDTNGLHVLDGVAKWVSLNSANRRLEFFGVGQGEVWIEGIQSDIRLTSDVRQDNSKYAGLIFDTKHGAGVIRERSAGIAIQQGGVEMRLESSKLAGSSANGTGLFLGFQGNQDALALGNVHPESITDGKGMRLTMNNETFTVVNNSVAQSYRPRIELSGSRVLFGSSGGAADIGFIDINGPTVSLYASGAARLNWSNVNIAEKLIQLNGPAVRVSSYLSVGGNIAAAGTISGATKNFVIVHPDPAKSGYVLRYSVTESPHVGVEDWSADEPVTIGESGSVLVSLRDHWPFLTHPFTAVQLTVVGETPSLVSYLPEGAGFRIYGAPGTSVVWLAKGVRRDVPLNIVEESDLDRAVEIAGVTVPSDEVFEGLITAMDVATTPGVKVPAEVAGANDLLGV